MTVRHTAMYRNTNEKLYKHSNLYNYKKNIPYFFNYFFNFNYGV